MAAPTRRWRVAGGPWYVTAAFVQHREEGGILQTRPVSLAHAKEMGTMSTACGIWAYSWRRILDLPFPIPPGSARGVDMCSKCMTVVIEEW
ncbi:hypothetical protein [Nocardioides sp. WS12]|uniref:hypothetical protein n=1 Tax=Nocardioides sp. WS12 TaxID=2486272 RepID=UPI0015F8125F|nr:hypothetical protein [Nocardioides sp. WS12]